MQTETTTPTAVTAPKAAPVDMDNPEAVRIAALTARSNIRMARMRLTHTGTKLTPEQENEFKVAVGLPAQFDLVGFFQDRVPEAAAGPAATEPEEASHEAAGLDREKLIETVVSYERHLGTKRYLQLRRDSGLDFELSDTKALSLYIQKMEAVGVGLDVQELAERLPATPPAQAGGWTPQALLDTVQWHKLVILQRAIETRPGGASQRAKLVEILREHNWVNTTQGSKSFYLPPGRTAPVPAAEIPRPTKTPRTPRAKVATPVPKLVVPETPAPVAVEVPLAEPEPLAAPVTPTEAVVVEPPVVELTPAVDPEVLAQPAARTEPEPTTEGTPSWTRLRQLIRQQHPDPQLDGLRDELWEMVRGLIAELEAQQVPDRWIRFHPPGHKGVHGVNLQSAGASPAVLTFGRWVSSDEGASTLKMLNNRADLQAMEAPMLEWLRDILRYLDGWE